jgi:hypothetical protein
VSNAENDPTSRTTDVGAELSSVVECLEHLVAETVRQQADADLDETGISALLTHAVKLYSAVSEQPGPPPPYQHLRVTPTEAVIAAAALLRAVRLTPFEFAIWFDGGGSTAER